MLASLCTRYQEKHEKIALVFTCFCKGEYRHPPGFAHVSPVIKLGGMVGYLAC